MPLNITNEKIGIYRLSNNLTIEECQSIANNPVASRLLLDEPLSSSDIEKLEEFVFSKRNDLTLIIYTFFSNDSSLKFLKALPSIRHLEISVSKINDVEILGELNLLETLKYNVFETNNFDFLELININLKKLHLSPTFSKKLNLSQLGRFQFLESLYIDGHNRKTEEIQKLKNLKEIVLRSITSPNLDYLIGLNELWAVDIKLGSIKDFSALFKLPNLKYLQLWQIRLLSDISFISHIHSLQLLHLQSLQNINKLPQMGELKNLRYIHLENLNSLNNLNSISNLTHLEDFTFRDAGKQSPEEIMPVLKNPYVKRVFCDFKSNAKNKQFKELADKHGKIIGFPEEFIFN